MSDIISPLDDILKVVEELKTANKTQRRSHLENALTNIISCVNTAKNNIILTLFNSKNTTPSFCDKPIKPINKVHSNALKNLLYQLVIKILTKDRLKTLNRELQRL